MFLISRSGLKKKSKKKNFFFFILFLIGKIRHGIVEKKWLFLIGNGDEIRPLEMGRKGPGVISIYIFLRSDRWGRVGAECSAQVKMVPIACAPLVANAPGFKMTRTAPLYTFCLYRVYHIDCHISHNSEKE